MSIVEMPIGASGIVDHMDLPLKLERRLEALGMIKGTCVTILNKKNHGAVIVKFRGTRFAIGKGIAKCIAVKV